MDLNKNAWKKCSTCKKDIGFNKKYYVCSVSTCNGQRTGYVFCSVICFESHVPGAKHRDAAAIESLSPSSNDNGLQNQPARKIIVANSTHSSPLAAKTAGYGSNQASVPRDILIVASKLKDYIKARADMNTSANVMEVLSDFVRRQCDEAIDNARKEGRKTVLDRDFKK